MLILPYCYGYVVDVKCPLLSHALIIFRSPTQVTPSRYGRQYPMSITHPIILSNIMGQWGATFHVKHERLFAISQGLFRFHTSDTPHKKSSTPHPKLPSPTHSPPTNRITTPFTRGGEVLITPFGNTLYNHPPLPTTLITSYIYTFFNPLTHHHQLSLITTTIHL